MHDPTWFAQMEREQAERDERLDEIRAELAGPAVTLCWRCDKPYTNALCCCPKCGATNANEDLEQAHKEMQQE